MKQLNPGVQALDLKTPFGEIEVLQENLDLIKRQLGIEQLEVLSATDPNALAKAGPLVSLLDKKPPSPGKPIAIFLSRCPAYGESIQYHRPIPF
ncbi:hypothetical protein L1049_019433 [Liquidambar formosana]|uniref:Uncharacterized protein n=1 Tax=Liquidambar formosana TaxID=63359 RepID=A0AAP0SBM4_LIQFO